MPYFELIGGLVLLGIGTAVFVAISDKDGKPRRWTTLPGSQTTVLFTVLGGWLFGVSFFIHSFILMFGG
jgi:hypothetical protein